ncbi:MAG: methylmalonyl-CoA epimerase [Candidatus Eremiobacteraeota bacterium]|nr:methylmalonyl-CoA epimerase [Candidatus Eremiobacteraeota bacterium]
MMPPGSLDHVGILVADLARSVALYETLGFDVRYHERIEEQGVDIVGLRAGDTTIELLQPLQGDSALQRFLGDRESRLHHLAYRVADIEAELRRLKAAGVPLLDETPRRGAHGNRIAFIHPRFSGGTLIELCQPDQA